MNRSNALKPPKAYNAPHVPPEREDDRLGRFVGMSVILHLVILAMLTLRAVFYPSEPLVLERAIRVDMVGLPDKQAKLPPEIKAEPKPEAKPEVKVEPKPQPKEVAKPEVAKPEKVVLPNKPKPESDTTKINLDKAKERQNSALKRLEAMRRLEDEAAAAKEAKKAAALASASPGIVRGNEISPGSSLTGIAKLENDSYLTSIDKHVKQHWDVPNFLANAALSASVVIFLDERGNIVKKNMVKSSGNQIFDQTVMTALDKASPFPAPPRKLVNIFMVDGVQLGFPE